MYCKYNIEKVFENYPVVSETLLSCGCNCIKKIDIINFIKILIKIDIPYENRKMLIQFFNKEANTAKQYICDMVCKKEEAIGVFFEEKNKEETLDEYKKEKADETREEIKDKSDVITIVEENIDNDKDLDDDNLADYTQMTEKQDILVLKVALRSLVKKYIELENIYDNVLENLIYQQAYHIFQKQLTLYTENYFFTMLSYEVYKKIKKQESIFLENDDSYIDVFTEKFTLVYLKYYTLLIENFELLILIPNIPKSNYSCILEPLLHNECYKYFHDSEIITVYDLIYNFKLLPILDAIEVSNDVSVMIQLLQDNLIDRISLLLMKNLTDRMLEVLQYRSLGWTLEEIGRKSNYTRERVRQIIMKLELKLAKCFNTMSPSRSISKLMKSCIGVEKIISRKEYTNKFGNLGYILLYLINRFDIDEITYEDSIEYIFVDCPNFYSDLISIIDERNAHYSNKILNQKDYNDLREYVNEYIIYCKLKPNDELINKIFDSVYDQKGEYYFACKLTKRKIVEQIIDKYFPDGIYVYDLSQLEKVREFAKKEYHFDLSRSDRSLTSIITNISILCEKGKYQLISKTPKLPSNEVQNIVEYIDNGPKIVRYIEIYTEHEDIMIKYKIANSYQLQGILRISLGKNYYFLRDAISKEKGRNFDDEVLDIAVGFVGEFTVHDIQKQRPTLTINMITRALNNDNEYILIKPMTYINVNCLNIDEEDLVILKDFLVKKLTQNDIVHIEDVFTSCIIKNCDILRKYNIESKLFLFSIFEYNFKGEFNFARPYIALINVEITKGLERLLNFIYEYDEITYSDMVEFMEDNSIRQIYRDRIIEKIAKNYVLIEKDRFVKREKAGITDNCLNNIKHLLMRNLDSVKTLKTEIVIRFAYMLPNLPYKWTNTLLNYIIHHYIEEIDIDLKGCSYEYNYQIFKTLNNETGGKVA